MRKLRKICSLEGDDEVVANPRFFEKFLGKTICEKASVLNIRALEQIGLTKKLLKKMDFQQPHDPWLWLPVLFGLGAIFYLTFSEKFLASFDLFCGLFFVAVVFAFVNRASRRALIFLSCALFLLGCFYADFYRKNFLPRTEISGKIYVDVVGKVESIKEFQNPQNGARGVNLLISDPVLYKAQFEAKKFEKKVKKKKAPKKKVLKKKAKKDQKSKIKKKAKKKKKSKDKKSKTRKKISEKTILRSFVNLEDYQEIDRRFLDYSKNYQQVEWLKIKGSEVFPHPPKKLSINLIKGFESLAVNDVVAVRAMLQPPKSREFPDDPDPKIDAVAKKIGAFGFAIGGAKILRKSDISSLDAWFLDLRESIKNRIGLVLSGDSAAIATALLVGDQSQISSDLILKIRQSGLAHLLSISGFHLSLAATICFVLTRFILSRSEYLTLHFDLKKIAAITTIIGAYFYLKIAASPIPAQRAFLMVLMVLLALFVGEKLNMRRALMLIALLLILSNPYVVFNVSFQLSFVAVLVLVAFCDRADSNYNRSWLRRFPEYFLRIIFLSILIQIATAPFLMRAFQNVNILGFVANVAAIPLVSFVIMPLGFLVLFLMPLHLEKYAALLMGHAISLFEKIAIFVANLDYSNFVSPQFTGFGLLIATLGLLLICLTKSNLRFVGVVVFLLSFVTVFLSKNPDVLFDDQQKFFAIFDERGLVFSKNLKPSKQRQIWMERMGEKEFKINSEDDQKFFTLKKKKFLVLTERSKISEICKNDFDVIVNLTAKYQLPDCVAESKIKIDNFDFYRNGGHFFYISEGEMLVRTTKK